MTKLAKLRVVDPKRSTVPGMTTQTSSIGGLILNQTVHEHAHEPVHHKLLASLGMSQLKHVFAFGGAAGQSPFLSLSFVRNEGNEDGVTETQVVVALSDHDARRLRDELNNKLGDDA